MELFCGEQGSSSNHVIEQLCLEPRSEPFLRKPGLCVSLNTQSVYYITTYNEQNRALKLMNCELVGKIQTRVL